MERQALKSTEFHGIFFFLDEGLKNGINRQPLQCVFLRT